MHEFLSEFVRISKSANLTFNQISQIKQRKPLQFINKTYTIAISGAAGQVAYSLLFMLARGCVFGPNQQLDLNLLEVEPTMTYLQSVEMELNDCGPTCIRQIFLTTDPDVAFASADYIVLLASAFRQAGMNRRDLLKLNKQIFQQHGQSIQRVARADSRILVVGNPANTNALILRRNAPKIQRNHITSLSRLDQNRFINQVSSFAKVPQSDVQNALVLGNHSATQVPIVSKVTAGGEKLQKLISQDEILQIVHNTRQRGEEIILNRGKSCAGAAASAICDHLHDWEFGTSSKVSCGIEAERNNELGVSEGLFFSFPCVCDGGEWRMVDINIDEWERGELEKSIQELENERDEAE